MQVSSSDVIYVDTIESVASSSGVVKLNLVRTKEAIKEGEEVQILPAGQIVMTLTGFLYAMSIMQGFLQTQDMQDLISKYTELGFIPSSSEEGPDM